MVHSGTIVFFAILSSFADGVNSVTWALVGDFFGRNHFASIRGWMGTIQSVVAMPGAVFTGWIYRPDTELHLCGDSIHRHLRLGWPGDCGRRLALESPQGLDVPAGRAMDIQPSRP